MHKPKGKCKFLLIGGLVLAIIAGLLTAIIILINERGFAIDQANLCWTKLGLEQIPTDSWSSFSDDDSSSLYLNSFPFPGDKFTVNHFGAWKENVDISANMKSLFEQEYISQCTSKGALKATRALAESAEIMFDGYSPVPTLFSDPIFVEETPIDFRMQFAADIDSASIGESAAKGRLLNPAGRRLREHYYRFPDQCDATPIALEVFLRLMIYDQIEAFFHRYDTKIGLFHGLFDDVEKRDMNDEELSVARWYGSRYAESYVHKIRNGWVYPLGERQNIDRYMIAVGLDPEDDNLDPTTPVGLGNLVGKRVTEWLAANDGLQKDNGWIDVEGLERITIKHPDMGMAWNKWKPSLSSSSRFQGIRDGIVTQQTFVSPSLGIFSFLYENEQDFLDLGLESAVPVLNMTEEAYIERSSEFLDIQRNMTDKEKAVAELSNNKISGSVFMIKAYVPLLKSLVSEDSFPRLYDEFSMVTSGCAEYAGVHAAWRHKREYLAGRPQTIISHLAKTNAEFLAAYPEAATFKSMIAAGDHPEYPSGSSTIYTAFVQAGDNWFKNRLGVENASNKTGPLTFTIPAGKFYWTDGPASEITLEYENLMEWVQELPKSRVYGGVHFMEAGEAGLALGEKVGNACSVLLERLLDGDMNATYTSPNRETINPFNTV